MQPEVERFLADCAAFLNETALQHLAGPQLRRVLTPAAQRRLAFVGQFNRGKSSLINRLAGLPILPTAVIPHTAIVTEVSHGPTGAVVEFTDGRTDQIPQEKIDRYVTEEKNPRNDLGVSLVRLSAPLPFLPPSVVLADTPGIGSVHEHNTKQTVEYLNRCDGFVFVLSVDPLLTAEELDFLRRAYNPAVPTLLVVNKTDYVEPLELNQLMSFLSGQLKSAGLALPVYPISTKSSSGPEWEVFRAALLSHIATLDTLFERPEVLELVITELEQLRSLLQKSKSSQGSADHLATAQGDISAVLDHWFAVVEKEVVHSLEATRQDLSRLAKSESTLSRPLPRPIVLYENLVSDGRRRLEEELIRVRIRLVNETEDKVKALAMRIHRLTVERLPLLSDAGIDKAMGTSSATLPSSFFYFKWIEPSTLLTPRYPLPWYILPGQWVERWVAQSSARLLERELDRQLGRIREDLSGRINSAKRALSDEVRGVFAAYHQIATRISPEDDHGYRRDEAIVRIERLLAEGTILLKRPQ